MKLALISDLHLRLDNPRARLDNVHETQKRKMEYVLQWCRGKGVDLLQAGDFFHKPRGWYSTSAWMDFFHSLSMPGYCALAVFGQHDQYMYSTENRKATALGILMSADIVALLGSEPMQYASDSLVHVYGASYDQEVPEVKDKKAVNILVIHKMIVDKKAWATQEDCVYAPEFLNTHKDFDLILCGDLHRKFKFESADGKGRIICNTGPLTRMTADKYNFSHAPGFFEYNTNTRKLKWHEIPHEPAEAVLTRDHIEQEQERTLKLDEFVEAVRKGEIESGTSFGDNLAMLIKQEKVNDGVKGILSRVMEGKE